MTAARRLGAAGVPFGVNLFGYITGNLGLGVSARTTATVLARCGVPTVLNDVDPGSGRADHDLSHRVLPPTVAERTPYQVNVFHLNPVELEYHLGIHRSWASRDRISVAVPFWELAELPKAWIRPLAAMDVILAPTRFIQSAIERTLPHAVCLPYRQAVMLPDGVTPDRPRWGLPADALVFVTSFDIASDIERKNPWAVVGAFREAFPGREDVRLVLKINSAPRPGGAAEGPLGALMRLTEDDPRVTVIARTLDYVDVLCLYASSDVLVSLHRSEGLGLTLMEAMSLGKPVIATGWSGNTDFMTPENSCAVPYRLVPVQSDHPAYRSGVVPPGSRWAEADVSACAAFMRSLDADPELRARMGERARRDMAELRTAVEGGELVETLRGAVDPGSAVWRNHRRRRAAFRRLAGVTVQAKARRAYRALRRSVGAVVRSVRRGSGSGT